MAENKTLRNAATAAFIIYRQNLPPIRIWEDGYVEGVEEGAVISNRLPALMAKARAERAKA